MQNEAPLHAALLPLVERFCTETDYSAASRRAVRADLVKFGRWYCEANKEPFDPRRVTLRDVADWRDWMRRSQNQSVSTVNRGLVSVRRFFAWLQEHGHVGSSPAADVKDLKRQELAPKTLDRAVIRKLLREAGARQDVRATTIFTLLLYCGFRVGELVDLTVSDLSLSERSGVAQIRKAKGNKARMVPLPLAARRAISEYLQCRGDVDQPQLLCGKRGPLTTQGVRDLFAKYSAIIGVRIHPHLLRHCFGREFLASNQNDLVGLAALMGHENLNTTRRYVARTTEQLCDAAENMTF
jgi:site-specific recombinase XerD